MGLLLSILVIALVVLVHEYGHYVLMRRNGVQVVEFTIGFGPTLFERKLKSGTMFRIKPILLGGYTRPVAEGDGTVDSKSAWARFKIYMAGMFFNATAAFVVYAVLTYATHRAPVFVVNIAHMTHAPPALMPLVCALIMSYGLWLATPAVLVWMVAQGMQQFFGGMAGPIGIMGMGGSVVAASPTAGMLLVNALSFFAMLNIGLAGFNLLPVYPLDGGRVFDILLEKVFGKRSQNVIRIYRTVSTVSLLAFIALIILSDVLKAFLHFGQ
ncbi:MAG: metalloprotease RseP [Candidatus Parcubacteria bacterium]